MKKVTCYKTTQGAMRALDNGGRFFNLFSSAGDALVTAAELKKAAGGSGKESAFLFFEMALRDLGPSARKAIFAKLEPALRRRHEKHGPTELAPSAFEQRAEEGRAYILEGRARRAPSTVRTGTILVPIMIGTVMTLMSVPVSETCQVFELRDGPQGHGPPCLVVIPKQAAPLAELPVRLGGIAKQMTFGEQRGGRKLTYLDPCCYTPLE